MPTKAVLIAENQILQEQISWLERQPKPTDATDAIHALTEYGQALVAKARGSLLIGLYSSTLLGYNVVVSEGGQVLRAVKVNGPDQGQQVMSNMRMETKE